jgi:hypothetical protein
MKGDTRIDVHYVPLKDAQAAQQDLMDLIRAVLEHY